MDTADLTPPERLLWEAFPRAAETDLRTGDPDADDPAGGGAWPPERTVRAQVISALLLGARESEPGQVAAIRLRGARISGVLDLDYAEFSRHLRLQDCSFDEPVYLYGARTRQLSFLGSYLPGFNASLADIDGNLRLLGCHATDRVRLDGAHIAGALLMSRADVRVPGGAAVTADRIQVGNDILLDRVTVIGEVRLGGGRVGGSVRLEDTRIDNAGAVALSADRLQVEGDIAAQRLEADGMVRLGGGRIAGALHLGGARLRGSDGIALRAARLQIERDISGSGLRTEGAFRIPGARVGGTVFLGDARLSNPGGRALYASSLEVGSDLIMRSGFRAEGQLRLASAVVTGSLDLTGARLTTAVDESALVLRYARVRELDVRTEAAPVGAYDLRHATLGVLRDAPATWPARLHLDGAVYEQLSEPLPAAARTPWAARGGGYQPQPYEQLAAHYRRLGHDDEARRVLLAKQRARRAQLRRPARVWRLLQDVVVGYGYRPSLAMGWLLALLVLGTVVFAVHQPVHMERGKPSVCGPLTFTLDQLLPVGDIGHCQDWQATSGTQWLAYLLTAAGWVLTTTVATGVARSLNRT